MHAQQGMRNKVGGVIDPGLLRCMYTVGCGETAEEQREKADESRDRVD